MILNFQLTNVESKVYSASEDIRKYKNININYDVNLKNPTLVSQNTPFGDKSVLRVEYTFAINYSSLFTYILFLKIKKRPLRKGRSNSVVPPKLI